MWRDYLELTKPTVVLVMLITVLVGMILASPGLPPLVPMIAGFIGIAFCSGASAAVNHVIDRKIDLEMARTHDRPVAQGRVSNRDASIFATVLCVAGLAILFIWVNALTAWLTLASSIGYAFVYTVYLKRATPQNIVIGGIAGAAPPLLGWTSITNSVDALPLLLVLIIYVWTPPHFWALAIHRKDDYAKVGVPMLPVTHGVSYTKLQIMLYTFLLIAVTLLPFAIGQLGWLYLLSAVLLGAGFLYWSAILMWRQTPSVAMKTFTYSCFYLLAIFAVMIIDHWFIAKNPIFSASTTVVSSL